MPKGPKGEKRPADVIANAVKVMRIATGEEEEEYDTPEAKGKDPAAVSMGSKRGQHSQSIEPSRATRAALTIANKSVVFDALCHGSESVMVAFNTRKGLLFS